MVASGDEEIEELLTLNKQNRNPDFRESNKTLNMTKYLKITIPKHEKDF